MEFYGAGAFITVTGHAIGSAQHVVDRTDVLKKLYTRLGTEHESPLGGQDAYFGQFTAVDLDTLPISAETKRLIRQDPQVGKRSEVLYSAICSMVNAGIDDTTIASVLTDSRYGISSKPLSERNGNRVSAAEWLMPQVQKARATSTRAAEAHDEGRSHTGGYTWEGSPPGWTTEPKDVGAGDGWPEIISLDTPPVSDISPHMLPGWLGDMAQAVADCLEIPGAVVVGQAQTALAACVQGKAVVEVEPGYYEALATWAMGLLDPGCRKTGVVQVISEPLRAWEREQAKALEDAMIEAESQRKTLQEEINALRKARAKMKDADEKERLRRDIDRLEKTLPPVPVVPMIYVEDITPEHLGTVMNEQSGSLAILSDEGGLLDNFLGRYSSGVPNLDLILKGHSGSSVKVNRGSRPPVWIDRATLSMGITPQLSVLSDAAKCYAFVKRGGLARFEYAIPVNPLGSRTLKRTPIPREVRQAYHDNMTVLLNMDIPRDPIGGEPVRHVLALSDDAYREWKDFQCMLEPTMRESARYGEYPIRGWVAKLPGAAARVATLFHFVEHLDEAPHREVDRHSMEMAIALMVAKVSHAEAAFHLLGIDERVERAKKILGRIQDQHMDCFTRRDVHRPLQGSFASAKDLDEPLQVLIDRGYIRAVQQETKRGRPSKLYETNPHALRGCDELAN